MVTFLSFTDPVALARAMATGPAFTMVEDESPAIIACGGILPLWRAVGELWMVSSPLVEAHGVKFTMAAIRMVEGVMREFEMERVQTSVDVRNEKSIKLLNLLKFKNEGVMRKYIGGRDFFRYARVEGGA